MEILAIYAVTAGGVLIRLAIARALIYIGPWSDAINGNKAFQRIKVDYDVIQYPFEMSPNRFNAGNRVNGLLFFFPLRRRSGTSAKRHESDSGQLKDYSCKGRS